MNEINEIIDDLDNKIRTTCFGKFYSDYYVGITNDIQRRLVDEHGVHGECHWYHKCSDKKIADSVEQLFMKKGMMGSHGGGTEKSVYVYVYRITPFTLEAPTFSDFGIIQEQRSEPTVQLYSSTHLNGYKFWKIRFIGKEQLTQWFLDVDKVVAIGFAEEYAKEVKAVVEHKESIGAIISKI